MRSLILAGALLCASCITHRAEPWAGSDLHAPRPGPRTELRILEDPWGVPHIRGGSEPDVAFGLGFVHAEDRLWQMELSRRIGAGRLSEVFGRRTLDADRYLRTLGFTRLAADVYAALPETERAVLDAYVAGVNAGIDSLSSLPPEYRILGFRPEPWTAVQSLTWAKVMALQLSLGADGEVLRDGIHRALGEAGAAAFLPGYPEDGVRILPEDAMPELLGRADEQRRGGEPVPEPVPDGPAREGRFDRSREVRARVASLVGHGPEIGSNNWVVGPALTRTGGALLANDPHLGVSVPSIWYLAELDCPELHVIGTTFPGMPGVALGHNEHIAWGATNVGADVTDLFLETPDPKNPERVRRGAGWEDVGRRVERIEVKGRRAEELVVRSTSLGPIVTEFYGEVAGEGQEVALRWTALDPGDTTASAFWAVQRASDWSSFRDALSLYVAPAQNFVFADRDGNIGYKVPGRIPRRAGRDGARPADGSDPGLHWRDPIPFDELPESFNPARGWIVTANNLPVPASYPHPLGTHDYGAPYRAQRITDRLGERSDWDVAGFEALQMDVVSLQARELLPRLRATAVEDPALAAAAALLVDWDGSMDTDSAAAALYQAWIVAAVELIGRRRLPEPLFDAWFQANAKFLRGVLLGEHGRLCATEADALGPATADCDALLRLALERAVDALSARLGRDPSAWRWGELHPLVYHHRLGVTPHLRSKLDTRIESPGGRFTVNVGPYRVDRPFEQHWFASYRQVIDPEDWNRSTWMFSPGQSGVPWRAHYRDLVEPFVRGERIPMLFGDAVDAQAVRTRVLRPGG